MNATKIAINIALLALTIGAGAALMGSSTSTTQDDMHEGMPLLEQFDVCQETRQTPCEGSSGSRDQLSVTENLTLTDRHDGAITIDADGVTLDCAGHAVIGRGEIGINVGNRAGVTVENCEVWGFDVGVWLNNTIDSTIRGNTASANDVGFLIIASSGNHLEDNEALLNGVGFRLDRSHANRLVGNLTSRGHAGFEVVSGEANELKGNEATDTRSGIVVASQRNLIVDNDLNRAGIEVHGGGNTISSNDVMGTVSVQGSSNEFIGNRVSLGGFRINGSENAFTENVVSGPEVSSAFHLFRANNNVFTDNRTSEVGLGFDVDSSRGNSFVGNNLSTRFGGLRGQAVTLSNTFTDNIGLGLGDTLVVSGDLTLPEDHEGRIVIDVPGVTLDCDGHSILPAGGDEATARWATIGIEVREHDDVTIENCNVAGYEVGIALIKSSGSTLIGNETAIWLRRSSATNITGNTGSVISLTGSSNRNTIANNTVGSITLEGSNRNTVTDNTITNGPLRLKKSDRNSVMDNTVQGREGIELTTASDNTITGNEVSGPWISFAIRKESDSNVIESNVIADGDVGFAITYSHGNALTANTLSSTRVGFNIRNAHDNILRANDLTGVAIGLETTDNERTYGNELIDNIGM